MIFIYRFNAHLLCVVLINLYLFIYYFFRVFCDKILVYITLQENITNISHLDCMKHSLLLCIQLGFSKPPQHCFSDSGSNLRKN